MSSQQTATMMIVVSPSGASRRGATYCRKLSLVPIAVETGSGLVCQPGGQPGDSHGRDSYGRASLEFQDGWGHRKPARRNASAGTSCPEFLARNSLHCCPRSGSENPGIPEPRNPKIRENRCAIFLLEPLIPTSWRSLGSPEWGSWSQYQKDSGAGRKSAISGHLGGWPMEGVFFSYGVWSSHSVGVLRKGFSSFKS